MPSTRSVSTRKPAASSVARADSAPWPTTPGTATCSGPDPTVSRTGRSEGTCAPGAGSVSTTLSWSSGVDGRASFSGTTWNPASSNANRASAGDIPMTLGTDRIGLPVDTTRFISEPTARRLPAIGSDEMT